LLSIWTCISGMLLRVVPLCVPEASSSIGPTRLLRTKTQSGSRPHWLIQRCASFNNKCRMGLTTHMFAVIRHVNRGCNLISPFEADFWPHRWFEVMERCDWEHGRRRSCKRAEVSWTLVIHIELGKRSVIVFVGVSCQIGVDACYDGVADDSSMFFCDWFASFLSFASFVSLPPADNSITPRVGIRRLVMRIWWVCWRVFWAGAVNA
jgi:hypothetical protein